MALSLTVLFIPFDAAVSHKTRNAGNGVDGQHVTPDPSNDTNTVRTGRVPVEAQGVPMTNAEHVPLGVIVSDTCRQALDDRRTIHEHPYAGTPAYTARSAEKFEDRIRRRLASRWCPDLIFLSEEPKGVPFEDSFVVTLEGVNIMYEKIGFAGSLPVQRIAAYRRSGQAGFWNAEAAKKDYQGSTEHILVATYVYGNESCRIAGVHLTSKNTAARPGTASHDKILSELRAYCQAHKISLAIGDFNADVRDYAGATVGALPHSTKFYNRLQCAACGEPQRSTDAACAKCLGRKVAPNNKPAWIEQFSNSVNTAHYMGLVVFGTEVFAEQRPVLSLQRSLDAAYFSDHPPIYADVQFGANR